MKMEKFKNDKYLSEIIEVVSYYYKDKLNQKEIARKLFYSPSKVSRMINRAFELGLIELKIKQNLTRDDHKEEELKRKYQLKDVLVFNGFNSDDDNNKKLFYKFIADYLDSIIEDGFNIGIDESKILFPIFQNLNLENKKINFFKLTGVQNNNFLNDDNNIFNLILNKKSDHNVNLPFAPIFLKKELKEALINESTINQILSKYAKLNIIISTIEVFSDKLDLIKDDIISKTDYFELKDQAASFYYLGHFFDKKGRIVSRKFEDSLIGISLNEIQKCPNTILIAYDINKLDYLKALLELKIINSLIIIDEIASKLL